MQIGAKFNGSPSIQTSSENQEIVPSKSAFYKFSFVNDSPCTVKINDSNPIYLRANQGFSMNQVDAYISSFVIIEAGIQFNWLGGSR